MTLWESLPREHILVPADALSREVATAASLPGAVSLSAAERLAARLYADLSALAGPTGDGLRPVLAARPLNAANGAQSDPSTPELLEDDPRLALRLMVADIEQLWRDQLIAAAALALVTGIGAAAVDGDSTPTFGGSQVAARCLLVYRVRPWSATPDGVGADRSSSELDLSSALPTRLPRGRLTLLLSWTPAVARRSWVFPRQVYTFQWEPACAVVLDRDAAAAIEDEDEDDADEWLICRLRRHSA